jgi:antitoxin component of MazEF toxin-antitoxin module
MTKKNRRSMKVVAQSGYKYRETPTILLKGQWLKELGFKIGDYVSVSCEDGRLVITPDVEKAKLVEAEKAFMDREMKALQERFEAEKEKIHAQFVAEREVGYGSI